uniref:DNA-directed DNA polymerase n=1 Tax=candidate division WOR-3 bacterium TaxID=2052148 RepID=A0A7V3VTK8_UNCW3
MYIPLLYHSNYGYGGSDFRTLFETLRQYQIPACGIVDDTFFGLNEFLKYAREYGVKPIIGARILIQNQNTNHGSTWSRDFSPVDKKKLYLLVKNKAGYTNLCKILTWYGLKKLDINFIKEHATGLLLLSNSLNLINELAPAFTDIYFLLVPYSGFITDKRIPLISANEIFYVNPGERIIYKLLAMIKKFRDEDGKKKISYLIKPDKFTKIYNPNPEAVKNLFRIAEQCTYIPEAESWIFPETRNGLFEIIKPLYQRLGIREKMRVEFEYRIIKDMGFEPYFVLIYELKKFAKEKGIGINVRGSAASSFILYLLGLSVVNPLKYNLPFERFLNQKRSEPPDIDLDVEYNQREYLINEIYKKFGKDYVARISMINRFQTNARFRDTARAFGISPEEIRKIEEHLGEKLIDRILKISSRIDGYPRYFSTHPSGIVITPKPVYCYTPLYPGPMGLITHFDKEGIGITGLVKLDILGVRGFPELYLKKEGIDFEDPNVYQFISEAKTLGCFQIESPMVRQILKKIKPKHLMDIANAIAIIRPGPAKGGMKERFLRRLNGEEEIDYPHSDLEDILKETLGIPVYQEQILNMAHRFAGFNLDDADLLRRAMTKERESNLMDGIRERFFSQARGLGYDEKEIERVWERISSFSSFGFNKAHSITYATLAYLSAYQKLYNPLEFFCRLLNNQGGYYPFYAYINEARRWGIKILEPDINKSEAGFTIENGCLRTGLGMIRNLSYTTIKKIINLRPFKTPEDFFILVQPDVEEGLSLIKSGALNTFKESWTKLYFKFKKSLYTKKSNFAAQVDFIKETIDTEYFSDFDASEKLRAQFSVLGFIPAQHILEFLYPERQKRISDINAPGRDFQLTCLVIAKRTILTRNRRLMSFYTMDDETGILESIIFKDLKKFEGEMPIVKIKGYLKNDFFYASVI